jgi:hypothetical protein
MPTQTRVPTGIGSANNWTGDPETTNKHLNVDEGVSTPDDDTSFNHRGPNQANDAQYFTFTAFSLGGSVSAVNSVAVVTRARRAGAGGTASAVPRIIVNGTVYSGSNFDPGVGGAYADGTETFFDNPDTPGLDWEQADVEGTGANPLQEFGHGSGGLGAGSGDQINVTTADLVCDYDEAAGETEIPTGRADETDSALAPAVRKLLAAGLATETDAALAPALVKRLAPAIAAELDTALAPTLHRTLAPGIATESDLALALSWTKRLAPGLAAEVDAAVALSFEGQSLEPPGSVRVKRLGPAAVEVARTGIGAVRVKRLGPASVTVSRG